MPDEHAAQVAELFKSAAEIDPSDRVAFLEEQCGSNAELRSEVESLLRTQERAGQFMERPALDVAAKTFTHQGGGAVAPRTIGNSKCLLIGKVDG